MESNEYLEAVTYLSKEPDIELLSSAYSTANSELGSFYRHCREAYDGGLAKAGISESTEPMRSLGRVQAT